MISTRAISRVILATFVLSTGLMLAGCEDTRLMEMFDGKKKLPGERKQVFPEGIPGVQQGVPPELMKGYRSPEQLSQTPADQNAAPAPAQAQASASAAPPADTEKRGIVTGPRAAGQPEPAAEPEKKAAPSKLKRVAKPRPQPQAVADAPPQPQPVSQAQARWPTPQQETQQQEAAPPQGTTRPWPGSAPAAPPSDRFSR